MLRIRYDHHDRDSIIPVLLHELMHVDQFLKGRIHTERELVFWDGVAFSSTLHPLDMLWELDVDDRIISVAADIACWMKFVKDNNSNVSVGV
ncbi:hypothetical protein CHH28_13325 [Bacterioplanes sanyensis]|uniref:Phage metallopeptidase domain-containing protein n=2 Tax=Bacterioplanes sanyensis TaxID=1249553 RepID=A0A222FMI7_9GAMM|nr:hypothetical protein CHH28_13325 [Bacterioplanes sanyensis]